jgi:hypothetical protein
VYEVRLNTVLVRAIRQEGYIYDHDPSAIIVSLLKTIQVTFHLINEMTSLTYFMFKWYM